MPDPQIEMGRRDFGKFQSHARPVDIVTPGYDANRENKIKAKVEEYLGNEFTWLDAAKSYMAQLSAERLTELASLPDVRCIKLLDGGQSSE